MFFHTPRFDLDLLVFINQYLHWAPLNLPMELLSSKTLFFVLLALAAAWRVRRAGWRELAFFCVLLAALGLTDLTTNVVKGEISRVRPLNSVASTWYVEDGQWRQRPETFARTKAEGTSYPSAHAANTACLAGLAALLWPGPGRRRLCWAALPLLVGFSRVYLGKHFPTDVVAGWLFGGVTAGYVWLAWQAWVAPLLGLPSASGADG